MSTPHTAPLGNRTVTRIGFGAMQLAGPGVMGPPKDPEAARAVLRRVVEDGVNHIDTAQFYGPDVVNGLIHDTLFPYPDDLLIATKIGAVRSTDGTFVPSAEPADLVAQVEENLRALKVEQVGLVNMRRFERDQPDKTEPDVEPQLEALAQLQADGKIGLIGLSSVTRPTLERALDLVDVAAVQNPYSILDRSDEDVLELCIERGIAYVPYFPLGSAFTGGPAAIAADPRVSAVAERTGHAPSAIALAWLLARYDRLFLIPGTSSVEHLEQNLAVGDVELSDEDVALLSAPIGE